MSDSPTEVTNFFLAMQAGRSAAEALESYFAEDAVYEEPFSGEMRRHEGRAAIMAAMASGWETPLADTRIEVLGASVQDGEVHVRWACHSPSLPGGQGRGLNRFTLKDGRILRLITTLDGGAA